MVEDLKTKRWTFTYIGTDYDVDTVALSLSITNVMKFKKNARGVKDFFAKESKARYAYSEKLRNKINIDNDFYEEEKK